MVLNGLSAGIRARGDSRPPCYSLDFEMVSHGNKGRSRRSILSLFTVTLQTIKYKQGRYFSFGFGGEAAETEADRGVPLVEGQPSGVLIA